MKQDDHGKVKEIFPTLETERLLCRQLSTDDAAILHSYWSDEEVTKYFSLDPFKNIAETIDMIVLLSKLLDANLGVRWAITRKQDHTVLGTCGFHNYKPEHSRVEMGYELGKEFWGQGIMAEALTAILAYGFTQRGYNRVEAFVNFGNAKSIRILKNMGFKQDGLLRDYEFNRGAFVSQYCYSLLKRDYLNR